MDLNRIRLCLVCQQEALQAARAERQDGLAMPQVSRPDVMVTFLRAGGYSPDRTHQWMELGKP